jgi:heat shock protein HtpX
MTRFVNNLKTTVLLAAIMGLALGIGSIWGSKGLMIGFVFGGLTNVLAYFFSDKIALATMRAQEVSPAQAPQLHRIVEDLSDRAGIPKPRVYVSPTAAPNAFATGRSPRHAAVCVTDGLLRMLSWEELSAVLGHELAHIKHYDILISSIAATVAGAITVLAHLAIFLPLGGRDENGGANPLVALLMIIFAPIAATIIQLAISRSREYAADHRGAEIHGNPLHLAHALVKLENSARRVPLRVPDTQKNMFIVQPFSGESVRGLFSTHPPTKKRVEKLYGQAGVAA